MANSPISLVYPPSNITKYTRQSGTLNLLYFFLLQDFFRDTLHFSSTCIVMSWHLQTLFYVSGECKPRSLCDLNGTYADFYSYLGPYSSAHSHHLACLGDSLEGILCSRIVYHHGTHTTSITGCTCISLI